MSRGLGRVEQIVLAELRQGKPVSVNQLAIAVLAYKRGVRPEDTGIVELPTSCSVYQSTARAVRSLTRKGIITTTSN